MLNRLYSISWTLLLLQPGRGAILASREPSANADAGKEPLIQSRDESLSSREEPSGIQARAADCNAASYAPVFLQGDPGVGIGRFDLKSTSDRVFAFDYDQSGQLDHLVLYRPGTGAISILANRGGVFLPRYAQTLFGIGGYDLGSASDLAFAYDYESSGRLDHIVLYRPGTGTIWILKNTSGFFRPIYRQTSGGIGGYDLRSTADRALAFDYDHSGKQDHLVLYRAGSGIISILKNEGGNFRSVVNSTIGIGGYDLQSADDLVFAFDYASTGMLDYLVLYRPGAGAIWILRNVNGVFTAVYLQANRGKGIGGFDLLSRADRGLAFDFANTGRLDHLVFYRPGTGIMFIIRDTGGQFSAVYQEGISGRGLGGYDLLSPADQILAFNYESRNLTNYLIPYRPGTGAIWILRKS